MLPGWDTHVITQRIEHLSSFPVSSIDVVPRSAWRWLSRARERAFDNGPWQASTAETDAVIAKLQATSADVLHIFFGNVAVHWLRLLEHVDVPVVVSFHGADVAGAIAGDSYRSARKAVFSHASLIACRSDALAERVILLGAPREKIRVTRTVVPVAEICPRDPNAAQSRQILQASRLVPKKGLATTLQAFAKLQQEVPEAQLVIAGEGPMEEELRDLATELGVGGSVRFTGFIDQSALASELARSAAFVHPSETVDGDTEGVPNSLLEAMGAGVPVVATRHGGIVEAVEDGVTGYLASERDSAAIAEKLKQLVSNPAHNLEMGAAGYTFVRENYSEKASAAALAKLYQTLI